MLHTGICQRGKIDHRYLDTDAFILFLHNTC